MSIMGVHFVNNDQTAVILQFLGFQYKNILINDTYM